MPQHTDKIKEEWNPFDELNKKVFEICNRPMMGNWSVMQSCRDVKKLLHLQTLTMEGENR